MQTILIGMGLHFWERDWLAFLFAPVIFEVVGEAGAAMYEPTVIILADSEGRHATTARRVLAGFARHGTPVCLIHLSDEFLAAPIDFYAAAGVVIRNYFRPSAAALPHVLHIPLGYKSGFTDGLHPKPLTQRQYQWFFAGEIKASRRRMLDAAGQVSGGRAVTTRRWDDPAGLGTAEYAAALADTVYAPCPRGNDSVDCFRVYEALEAGAIPLVEDDGRFDALLSRMFLPAIVRSPFRPRGRWTGRYRARFGHSYWISMFDGNFPLPRVHRWDVLPDLIRRTDAVALKRRVDQWWTDVKDACRTQIRQRLDAVAIRRPDTSV